MEAYLTWQNVLIAAAIIAVLIIFLGSLWRLLKRLIFIWLIVVVLLVGFKLVFDAGLLA